MSDVLDFHSTAGSIDSSQNEAVNYQFFREDGGKPIKAWVNGVQLEEQAKQQLINISKLPFIHKHIAVMPDVHLGIGATVGSVIPTIGAIIPAAVGVDLGCGMMAVQTNIKAKDLPDNLVELRNLIEAAIPHGRTENGQSGDKGAWSIIPENILEHSMRMQEEYLEIVSKHPKIRHNKFHNQLGTLGTGNHFVEVCLDEKQKVWVMLHSGSRGIGNSIGRYFIEKAKEEMRKFFVNLPDQDLAYLPEGSKYFKDYIEAVKFAQDYAARNRYLMMDAALNALASTLGLEIVKEEAAINCHHNYVSMENHFDENVWVTRKGAVRARYGELGIIPGSMGAKSFIVRGKENADSFHSCSHGAGRKMSRNQARKEISLDDHIAATQGVECRKDAEVIDESPAAYKDIDAVMAAQSDLVEVVHTLKQILCVKG